jgi:selenide, water dikinase
LSDIFAMGGKPLLALNMVCFPADRLTDLNEIIRGGVAKVQEAGAILVGGHSLKDKEPKYGLAVLGMVHPERFIRNHTPQEGDVLIVTKPLGTGIISTALKAEMITIEEVQKAVDSMMQLNRIPESILNDSIHSMTDITGFGFLGHLHEMLVGGDLVADIQVDNVPVLDMAHDLSRQNMIPGGSRANQQAFSCAVKKEKELDVAREMLLYDAQTSGGLLMAIDRKDAEQALRLLIKQGFTASRVVGHIRKRLTDEKKINLV